MPVAPAEREPGGDLRHAGSGPRREMGAGKGCAGMPKLAVARNVVHNDSRDAGPASWHDEAPKGLRFLERNLMLNRSADGNRTGNPFGEPCKALRCQKGAPAEATAIASRLGGPGRQTHMGAAPEGLRHLNPLDRGAGRGISRQHEHPVEGPATCEVADPTAGCSVCACGGGYPDHVATSCLLGVSVGQTTPTTRSLARVVPPGCQAGRRGHSHFRSTSDATIPPRSAPKSPWAQRVDTAALRAC